jgi:hypothetical protein
MGVDANSKIVLVARFEFAFVDVLFTVIAFEEIVAFTRV